jgi:CDP-diacylglycerol--serine O-phosphatidyltransferase
MLNGFAGIAFSLENNPRKALACLMIAGLCDMFDGKIASTRKRTKQEKRFGVQIDSLSDLICFGVLPAVIVYSQHRTIPVFILSAFYLLCALIRLAWYNVDEEERQDRESGRRTVYTGLPVTFSALIFPIVMNLGISQAGPLALLVTGIAFLTPFHVEKPDFLK